MPFWRWMKSSQPKTQTVNSKERKQNASIDVWILEHSNFRLSEDPTCDTDVKSSLLVRQWSTAPHEALPWCKVSFRSKRWLWQPVLQQWFQALTKVDSSWISMRIQLFSNVMLKYSLAPVFRSERKLVELSTDSDTATRTVSWTKLILQTNAVAWQMQSATPTSPEDNKPTHVAWFYGELLTWQPSVDEFVTQHEYS